MAIATVRAILMADPTVISIVGDRITPVIMPQTAVLPALTLERIAMSPSNALSGWSNLDMNTVQVGSWADTYDGARALADAVRAALQAANLTMSTENDHFDPGPLPGVFEIVQDFWIFTAALGV